MISDNRHYKANQAAFTLVELLVSTAVLTILLLVIVNALDSMQRTWSRSKEKVDQYREARTAFESITRQLSQATLNTYWDYYYTETGSNTPPSNVIASPSAYVRHSELQYLSGPVDSIITKKPKQPVGGHVVFFQAPLGHTANYRGLSNLLNSRGFYVQWRDNRHTRPRFLPSTDTTGEKRYQLMEYRPIAEKAQVEGLSTQGNTIYSHPDGWHEEDLEAQSKPIATNILALIISPLANESATAETELPSHIAPKYIYNSRDIDNSTVTKDSLQLDSSGEPRQGTQHLLPPLVQVTLVAADEISFENWLLQNSGHNGNLLASAGADFTSAARYQRDMQVLTAWLTQERINHRVFSVIIPLRNASWDERPN